jgi:radical SAM-linked protein
MVRDKVRIRFRKDGSLRLVSHHDLMRCFERMLRRAALPFHSTAGHNPKPRLIFALSLALGIVGCREVVELELDGDVPERELQERLARQAPAGLTILSVQRIDPRAGAQVRRVCYQVPLADSRRDGLLQRLDALLAAPNCWIERTRPQARRLDIRPYLRALHLCPDALEIDLWVTPNGTARPEEILGLLGLGDLLDAGAVLQRTTLELHDEWNVTGPVPTTDGVSALAASGSPLPQSNSPDAREPLTPSGIGALTAPDHQPEGIA